MTMDAGRALDALVAEKVMHQNPHWLGDGDDEVLSIGETGIPVPHYSTEYDAAHLIIEKLTGVFADTHFAIQYRQNYEPDFWLVGWHVYEPGYGWRWSDVFPKGEGATIPLAICRAALNAVGVWVPA